jgi:hypothetical protein
MKLKKGDKILYHLPGEKVKCIVIKAVPSSGGHYTTLKRLDTKEIIYSAWDKNLEKLK